MAKLTKTDAAKCIGVTRATLYRYIKKGRISVDPDGTIDTAELLRAGFSLNTDTVSSDTSTKRDKTPYDTAHFERLIETLHHERDLLQRTLDEGKEREQVALREKAQLLDLLKSQQRLLEAGPKRRSGVLPTLKTWLMGKPAHEA